MKNLLASVFLFLSFFCSGQSKIYFGLQNTIVTNGWSKKIQGVLSSSKQVKENQNLSSYALQRAQYFATLFAYTSQQTGKSYESLIYGIPAGKAGHKKQMSNPNVFLEPDTLKFSPGTKDGKFGNEYFDIEAEIMVNSVFKTSSLEKLTKEEVIKKCLKQIGGEDQVANYIFESYRKSSSHYEIINKKKGKGSFGTATIFTINSEFSKEKNKWVYQMHMINVTNFGQIIR